MQAATAAAAGAIGVAANEVQTLQMLKHDGDQFGRCTKPRSKRAGL